MEEQPNRSRNRIRIDCSAITESSKRRLGTAVKRDSDPRVQRALSSICEQHAGTLSVNAIARSVNLSSSRLRHLVKAETGLSLNRYVKFQRLTKAKDLLASTFLSVKEIMVRVGYSDSSHFVRDFRLKIGSSPRQYRMWLLRRPRTDLRAKPSHPFYDTLNQILQEANFDGFVSEECKKFFVRCAGWPAPLVPGTYFRLLLVGYFEGIDSEKGIAWRVADSWGVRQFLSIAPYAETPTCDAISRARRLIDVKTHRNVFVWVLNLLIERGFLKGNTVGIHNASLEANAACRSIVRCGGGESYEAFLKELARVAGVEVAESKSTGTSKACRRTWGLPSCILRKQ